MPVLTIAVDMIARASTPGTSRSTRRSDATGTRSTRPKKASSTGGTISVISTLSPRRRASRSSVRACAAIIRPSGAARCAPTASATRRALRHAGRVAGAVLGQVEEDIFEGLAPDPQIGQEDAALGEPGRQGSDRGWLDRAVQEVLARPDLLCTEADPRPKLAHRETGPGAES